MMIIGIDPGLSGGIAWVNGTSFAQVQRMPDTVAGVADLLKLIIRESHSNEQIVAVLEKVHAMPKQGVSSVWTFAQGYGRLEGLLYALNIPVQYVQPLAWQRAIGATRPKVGKDASPSQKEKIKREGKRKIKEIVEASFPHMKVALAVADALGILLAKQRKKI